jgi:Protein of unknown function (DUF3147)
LKGSGGGKIVVGNGRRKIMTWQLVFRFVVGGLVVSMFAVLGDVLTPKSFAGLFGAAPSVALATLALTIETHGKSYAARECRSMIAGAAAFIVYAFVCSRVLMKYNVSAMWVALCALLLWIGCAVGAWFVFLR